jgi:hypothetical protein
MVTESNSRSVSDIKKSMVENKKAKIAAKADTKKKITAKMVDDTVKARKQPMGKGPKGGRMPGEPDGGIMNDKAYKAKMAKEKASVKKETKAKASKKDY